MCLTLMANSGLAESLAIYSNTLCRSAACGRPHSLELPAGKPARTRMLKEHFISSIGVPLKPPPTNVAKDAAIFVHEHQPLAQQRAIFKKSATPPNCLAVSASHIFAAQAEKAVVHVYSREKGNQEATVPFNERITCLSLACEDAVLVLGTVEGRIFLWETASGRQITTVQAHLQAVTALAVDATSNFLLSASADSTVHVWSIPSLLSYSSAGSVSPLRTFTNHRSEINAIVVGHSASFTNFAVTAGNDKTCLVWDFHANQVLRTYLLSATPSCFALDAADRAVYVGYEDGSLQCLDLLASPNDAESLGTVHNAKAVAAPIQPPDSSRWNLPDKSLGPLLSLDVSFDSCTVISGHESGALVAWDVATHQPRQIAVQTPMPGPVTNVRFLPVSGFSTDSEARIKIPQVVKPKFGAFDAAEGTVPGNYAVSVQLSSSLTETQTSFQQALSAPCFSQSLLDEGLSQLATWGQGPHAQMAPDAEEDASDFMALDDVATKPKSLTLEQQNAELKTQLDALRRVQMASFDKMEKIDAERRALLMREQKRLTKLGHISNGNMASDGVVDGALDADMEDDTSSSED